MPKETDQSKKRIFLENLGQAAKNLATGAAITIFAVTFTAELAMLCGVSLPVGATGIMAINFLIQAAGIDAFKEALKKITKREKPAHFTEHQVDQLDILLGSYISTIGINLEKLEDSLTKKIHEGQDALTSAAEENWHQITSHLSSLEQTLMSIESISNESVSKNDQILLQTEKLEKNLDRQFELQSTHQSELIAILERIESNSIKKKETQKIFQAWEKFTETVNHFQAENVILIEDVYGYYRNLSEDEKYYFVGSLMLITNLEVCIISNFESDEDGEALAAIFEEHALSRNDKYFFLIGTDRLNRVKSTQKATTFIRICSSFRNKDFDCTYINGQGAITMPFKYIARM